MARAEDVRALDPLCPWDESEFRAGMAGLGSATAAASVAHAAQVRLLAGLVAQVPRCLGDERGATPWTSFRREIATALKVTDRTAAACLREAVALTTVMPATLSLLDQGRMTVERAGTFVRELQPHDDDLVRRLDAELADEVALLPAWRVAQAVRRAAHTLDPEAGAQRVAVKNAARGVALLADADDQASLTITGPAVPLTRWHATLDQRARALKAAGDPRGLDALRFDLAVSTFGCAVHAPASTDSPPVDVLTGGGLGRAAAPVEVEPGAAAGLRPSFVEAAPVDCRSSRPVQAHVVVPVETALGLSNEPAWLDGYGWVSAPTARLLLVDAELRKACSQTSTGQLVDVSPGRRRPPPTPAGLREGLLQLVVEDATLSGVGSRVEPQHDPSDALRDFVRLRDRACDGPTGTPGPVTRTDLDHDQRYPDGPTAAWNLTARAVRSHQLKHYGWTPVRTPTMTVWASPSGQVVQVPHHTRRPPGIDRDGTEPAVLPDADELHDLDRTQLAPPSDDDAPPWLPASERPSPTAWTWLTGDDEDVAC